ncbi:MAG: hypothetical protein Q9203_004211 [Teloschistes exilis]
MPLTTPMDGARHPIGPRDWEHHRETIERLYVADDRSLPEVVSMMSAWHGFVATERQYKRRISDWHLDKNVKDEEMRAIIATESSRLQQGKRSVFYVRNRQVDSKKIDRFAHRKKIDKYRSAALAKSTLPPDVRCITPPEDGHSSLQPMPSQPKSRVSKRKATSHDLRDTTSTEHCQETQRRMEDLPIRMQEESSQVTAPDRTLSESYPKELYNPSSLGSAKVTSRTMSDFCMDELYSPSSALPVRPQHTVSRKMAVLHHRLQAAQQSHANITPKSLEDESFSTVAQIRQRDKAESDLRALRQHVPKPPSPPPRTVSPKEVALDYSEIDEDTNIPISPQNNGSHKSSLPSTIHGSPIFRQWTAPANLSIEDYLLELAQWLQDRSNAWEYIVDSFGFESDDVNLMGVVHSWQRILPWLKRGYMLNQALMRWSIALGLCLDPKSNKVDPGAKGYCRRTTNPLSREIILTETWADDATSPSDLRQESERINKDVDEVDILKHDMKTSRSDTTSQKLPASTTRGDQRGPPLKQAKLDSEQSNLRILSTIASLKESAETSSQTSSGRLSEGRFKSPFKEGSPYATSASSPTSVAQAVSPQLTTQPSASSASSRANTDGIIQIIDDQEERLHSKKGSPQQHHQLSKFSQGTSRNTSTTPVEPSADASGHQKDFSLRDQSHRIDLLDFSDSNYNPSSPNQAPKPLSETSLIDWGLADGDLPTRKSSERLFFTIDQFSVSSQSRCPKALDKDSYYMFPIAVAVSSLPASLRQRPIDMFYFRFFIDNTARLLVSHDCDSNDFRSILPRMALRHEHLLGLLLAYSASHRARLLGYPRPVARVAQWTRDIFPSLRHALVSKTSSTSNDDLAITIMLTSMTITCPDVFEVPIPWQHHLFNAKRLFKHLSMILEGGSPQSSDDKKEWDFLSRWLTYIAIIGSLNPPKEDGNFQQFGGQDRHHQPAPIIKSNEVDCLYGCTTELMDMLGAAAGYTNRHADVGTIAASLTYTCTSQTCTARFETAAQLQKHRREAHPELPPPDPFARPADNKSSKHGGDESATNNGAYTSAESILGAKWLAIANYRFPYRHTSYEGRNPSNGALEGMEVNAVQKLFSQANMVYIYRRIEGRPRHDASVQMHVQEIVNTVQLVSAANKSQPGILFPLFIAGCEARTDAQRQIVSDGFEAIEKLGMAQVRSMCISNRDYFLADQIIQ